MGVSMRKHSGADVPCQECGSTAIPVVYGLPGRELFEAAERGEIRLGGCVMPGWPLCRLCGAVLVGDLGRTRGGDRADIPSRMPGSISSGEIDALIEQLWASFDAPEAVDPP